MDFALLDLLRFRCARLFLVLKRLIALGLQFVVGLLALLGGSRVEVGGTTKGITALDERGAALLQLRVAQEVADGRVQRSNRAFIEQPCGRV